jgi:hypothetical protein
VASLSRPSLASSRSNHRSAGSRSAENSGHPRRWPRLIRTGLGPRPAQATRGPRRRARPVRTVWVRGRPGDRQLDLHGLGRRPAQPAELLADGLLRHPHGRGDLALALALRAEGVDAPVTRALQAGPACRVAAGPPERDQSTALEAALVPANAARRAPECPGDLVLVRPALRDELHHRVCLGHRVADRVVGDRHAGHEHRALPVARPQQAASVDPDRVGRRGLGWEQLGLGRLGHPPTIAARPEKADRFGSAPHGRAAAMSSSGTRRLCQEVWNRERLACFWAIATGSKTNLCRTRQLRTRTNICSERRRMTRHEAVTFTERGSACADRSVG